MKKESKANSHLINLGLLEEPTGCVACWVEEEKLSTHLFLEVDGTVDECVGEEYSILV